MAAFNNHNQQRIFQGIPHGNHLNGSWFNHGALNNPSTPQQLNQYQYGHQAQIVQQQQPQNHFQMQQCLIWAQQEAQAQQQRLQLAQEQRQQQDFSMMRQWQQPHTLQQSHRQQNPQMSQQGHILQQNQQQQPHILQQRHQQQSHQQQHHQQQHHPHILQQDPRQQPHVLQQSQQQQSHILQQRHQQQSHILQQSHQQQHPHILQQGQQQQPHVLQQNQQQQPHILQQRHQQQPHRLQQSHQQHQYPHILQRGPQQQPYVLQQRRMDFPAQSNFSAELGSFGHVGSQQSNPLTIGADSPQSHTQLNQVSNMTPNCSSNPNLVLVSATNEEVPCLPNLESPVINHSEIMEYLDTVEGAEQKNTSDLVRVIGLESKPEPKHKSKPIESKPETRPEPDLIEFKPETRPKPEPTEFKPVTTKPVTTKPMTTKSVTTKPVAKPVQEELVQQNTVAVPFTATSESTSMSMPVLIKSSQPIILMPSLGPRPDPISVPEPEASTSSTISMPSMTSIPNIPSLGSEVDPRFLAEPEASTSSIPSLGPRPEPRSLSEPKASTSRMSTMTSPGSRPGPRFVPQPETSTSSPTSDVEVNRKLFPKRKHKSKTNCKAVAEEKASCMPIIESGSGSEPSPSTSSRSSTNSDLELNNEIVDGKKRKRKPKPTYRALPESDSTEYETDDEGPRKVQKTKLQSTKLQPSKLQSTKLQSTKLQSTKLQSTKLQSTKLQSAKDVMGASPSSKVARAASQDLSKSEIRKSKAWQTRWMPSFDKLYFKASNKHLDHIFTSKSLGFETKKKFIEGEEKDIIGDNKNCNTENIVPKTKCSLCEGNRENPYTKCKHLVNDNSDSDYHSNSDNTLNYNAETQMDCSSGEDQFDTQQNHSEPKKEYVIQYQMHFDLTVPEVQIDNSRFPKTPLSYTQMAVVAILSTEHQKMSAYEMYTFIKENFPFYKTNPSKSWKSSLRHTLSGHKFFEDTGEVYINGKQGRNGSYWILSISKTSEIKREMKQCWNKNKEKILASTSDPERIAKNFKECDALKSIQKSPKKPQKCQNRIQRVLKNPQLVVLAIKNSPDGLVNTDELYDFCVKNFSDCSNLQPNFKNNLRHTLTFFVKYPSEEGGKNKYGMPLDPEKSKSMLQEVQDYCYKNPEKIKDTMIHPDQFSKIMFNIEDIVEAVQFEQINTSNLIGVGGLESKPEPRPKPELNKSKPEPTPKPQPIQTKLEPRSKPELIESKTESIIESKSEPRPKPEPIKTKLEQPRPKPEPIIESKSEHRPKPEPMESKPESRPKPEEENTFSMPIIEFGSGIEPSTSTSSRDKRNRGGY